MTAPPVLYLFPHCDILRVEQAILFKTKQIIFPFQKHMSHLYLFVCLPSPDCAPLAWASPRRLINSPVVLNQRTRGRSRCRLYYRARRLSRHDPVAAFPSGDHASNRSLTIVRGSVPRLQGPTLTNLISPFKWSFAPRSQHILRHNCVIVWIFSQDNSGSFCTSRRQKPSTERSWKCRTLFHRFQVLILSRLPPNAVQTHYFYALLNTSNTNFVLLSIMEAFPLG